MEVMKSAPEQKKFISLMRICSSAVDQSIFYVCKNLDFLLNL